jgi:hypothetical protein
VAVNDGKFVTQSGTTLTLYSADAKELNKLLLPPPPNDFVGWQTHPSPTGKSVLFMTNDYMATSPKMWLWVDTNSLEILRSWKDIVSGWIGISDSTVTMTACLLSEYHCEPNVEVRGLATEWKTIAPIEKQSHWGLSPEFVNQNTIFLSGHPWKLLQSDGKVVLTENAPFEGSIAVPSADGQRFVVPFFQSKGGVASLDIGAHGELKAISVYDAPFHQRSFKLNVTGSKIEDRGTQMVLSPSGSLLAILCDESVYLFQLPPTPASPQSSPANGAAHR